MTNCDKGKAGTVHPECIGEQHYSDEHGTGSAIKEVKAPDVDLQKESDASLAGVKDALEKAKVAMRPYKGSITMTNKPQEMTTPEGLEHAKKEGPLGYRDKFDIRDGRVINPEPPKRERMGRKEERRAKKKAERQAAAQESARVRRDPMYSSISESLNARGVAGPGGGGWTPEVVRSELDRLRGEGRHTADDPNITEMERALNRAKATYDKELRRQNEEDRTAREAGFQRGQKKARELMAIYGPNSPIVMGGTFTPKTDDERRVEEHEANRPKNTETDVNWNATKEVTDDKYGKLREVSKKVLADYDRGVTDYEPWVHAFRDRIEADDFEGIPLPKNYMKRLQDQKAVNRKTNPQQEKADTEEAHRAKQEDIPNLVSLEPGASDVGEFKDTTPVRGSMQQVGKELRDSISMEHAREQGAGSAGAALDNDPNKDPAVDLQTGRAHDGKGATPPSVRELNAQAKGLAQNKQEEPKMEQDKQASAGRAEIKDDMTKGGVASPVASIRDLMKAAEDEKEFAYPSGFRPKGANFDGRIHPYQEIYRTVYMDRDMPAMPDMDRVKRVKN